MRPPSYRTRPARVARGRRHCVSTILDGDGVGLSPEMAVEVWESHTSGGGLPERRSITIHEVNKLTGVSGFYVTRQAAPGVDAAEVVRALVDDLNTLNGAPDEARPHLQRLIEGGALDQALELAKSLRGDE